MKKYFALCVACCVYFKPCLSQQLIGSFPEMNGGFEGALIENVAYGTAQAEKWVKNNSGQAITSESTVVRSGATSLKINNGTTSYRVWSPLVNVSSNTSSVTVQFFRRVSSTSCCQGSQGFVGTGTTPDYFPGVFSIPSSANSWQKVYYTSPSFSYTNLSAGIMTRQDVCPGVVYLDDFVAYEGSYDVTAPSSPGLVQVANLPNSSILISWDAPAGGVDGGGYVVVRYQSAPFADNNPNQNGIYRVGNIISNGTGSLSGTVSYIGTNLSFFDNTGLISGSNYYYKVYAVDKAFNYSTASQGVTAYPLPVSFFRFFGKNQAGHNILNWTTTSEQNSSYFEVERSQNGTVYTTIGRVAAAGNSQIIRNYQFWDTHPPADISYYRLRQVDLDAHFSYSQVIQIANNVTSSFWLGPNPNIGKLWIYIPGDLTEVYDCRITSAMGNLVQIWRGLTPGQHKLDLGNCSAGFYCLSLWQHGRLMRQWWVKRE